MNMLAMKKKLNWFMHTPAWRINQLNEIKELEFDAWLADEVPDEAHNLSQLQQLFTLDCSYIDNIVDRKILGKQLSDMILNLDLKSRKILYCRYELDLSFHEISKLFYVTASRIRQIHDRALRHLRYQKLALNNLTDFTHLLD